MESLNIQMQPLFEWLLRTTVQASLLICVILLLQRILRNGLGIRWHYSLWLLLLVRMSLPWAPQSRASLFNLIPRSAHQQQAEYEQQENGVQSVGSDVTSSDSVESVPASPAVITQKSPEVVTATPSINQNVQSNLKPDFSKIIKILPLLWLIGVLVLALYVCAGNFNLWRIIKRRRPLTDQKILDLLEDCKSQMGIQTILGIVPTDKIKTPALFGFVRPRLLLPTGMVKKLSREELRFVFLHELAHLKRRDIYIGWLISVLQVLHWFNPLVWLAFRRMRADRELACDALVLARMQSEEPKSYGRIIVSLLERFSCPRFLPGMAGILETKSQLKRRVTMIAKFKKNSYQWSPPAVILIIILACVSLPDAVRTKASQTSSTEPAPKIALRRVWAGPGVDIEGAPSPDGRYLSYVDWDTGDLAIYEIATGKKRRLTNKGTWEESDEFAQFSRWSPDGKKIVYDWYNKKDSIDLCIVGLDGSKPRILYSNEEVWWAQTYGWAPDGKEILAYISNKDGDQIVLVSVADGSMHVLKTLNKYHPQNMSFSPDGRYIVHDFPQKEDSPESDISLLLIDGSREIPLIEHPADDRVLGWSPDGKHILFTSDRTGTKSTWLIEVADGEPQGDPKLVKQDFGQQFIPMGFTKDGSFYYGSGAVGVSDVYIAKLDPETGIVLIPTKKAIRRFEGRNLTPDYSPDGKYLAYTSTRGRRKFLCIRSVETGQEQEFHSKLKRILEPRWSPDGSSILVGGMDYKGNRWGIYRIDIKTGTFTLVLPPPEGIRLTTHEWSRDGKSFFVSRSSRKDKVSQIMLREIESGTQKEIYRTSDLSRFRLSCSPDGKWLAFINIRNNGALKIIPADGGEPRDLYKCEQKNEQLITLRWTADGKYILFVIREIKQKKFNLWRIPIEGGEPQKLGLEMNITSLSVHPDGQHIAFNAVTIAPAEVWVMENFLPEAPVAKPEPSKALRMVTDEWGIETGVSPDGRYMSYVDWTTSDLVVREIGTGNMQRLTDKGSWGESNAIPSDPVISPDNTSVAYVRNYVEGKKRDLYIAALDGSGERLLCKGGETVPVPLDWSESGNEILAGIRGGDEKIHLLWVSASDGAIREITILGEASPSRVDLSPHGRYVAYDYPQTDGESKRDILVYDLKNQSQITVVKHLADDKLLGWTPDGRSVFFASNRTGTWDGWIVEFGDAQLKHAPMLVKTALGDARPVGLTQKGEFYFGLTEYRSDVYAGRIDIETGEVIEAAKPVGQTGKEGDPDWSADGRYLAYCSRRPLDKSQVIRILSLESGKERELDPNLPYFRWLHWDPDGQSLLVGEFEGPWPQVIYRIDAKTSRRSVFLGSEAHVIGAPVSSNDGKKLLYIRRMSDKPGEHQSNAESERALVIRDLETGQEHVLSAPKRPSELGSLIRFFVAPDGRRLALVVSEGAPFVSSKNYMHVRWPAVVLKTISAEDSRITELFRSENSEEIHSLAWTPDGRSLLFWRTVDPSLGHKPEEHTGLWRMSAKGSEPEHFWTPKSWTPKTAISDVRVHPGTGRVAFQARQQIWQLWVMENFLPRSVASAGK